MAHPSEHEPAHRPLDAAEADALAESVSSFASASRLRLLSGLLEGERTVEQLAAAAEMSPSAVSHQLRLLRLARLVRVRRDGRHGFYALHDHHVADLLAALRHHHEHVGAPRADLMPDAAAEPARS